MGKINKTYIFAILLLITSACKVNKGKPCIDEEKMSDILAEAYIAPQTLSNIKLNKGDKKDYYYSNILERYGVTEAEFDSAMNWYVINLEENEKLYNRVQTKINIRINKLESE